MGYYSDVTLVLSEQANLKLQNELKQQSAELQKLFGEYTDEAIVDPKTKAALYYWEEIKWYEDRDDDIIFTMNFINGLNDNDYRFLRIGEEYGHIDVQGNFKSDPFSVRTSSMILFDR